MSADGAADGRRRAPFGRARVIAVAYFVLAVAGLVGTWSFNLAYTGENYIGSWFANAASSSAAVDILTVLLVSFVLYATEGRRVGLPWWFLGLLVPLSLVGAVACALPLFLGVRELEVAARRRSTFARPMCERTGLGHIG